MGLKKWFFALIMLCFIASCNDDSDIQPAYQFALTEVTTDHQGKAHTLLLDDGTELALNTPISGLIADSTYRLQALFVQTNKRHNSILMHRCWPPKLRLIRPCNYLWMP